MFEIFNEFKELCQARHSIRDFTKEPVGDEQLLQIMKTVQTAPSAGNLQAYEMVIVKDREMRQELVKAAYGQRFISEAPVVLVFFALPQVSAKRYASRGVNLYSIQDATIAATYAMLAATSAGLASTWVGAYNDEEVKRLLNAEPDSVPICIMPIGHADEEAYITSRRSLDKLIREI